MSLSVPTTKDLGDNILAQLSASLGQAIPLLPKAFLNVLAKVLAGAFILLYKYSGFIFLQLFVAYASDRETTVNGRKLTPLIELGRLFGVGDPDPATRAELLITVTVLNQVGELKSGQQLVRSESGFVYIVMAAVAMNAPTITVRIRATLSPNNGDGSGAGGNLQPGDVVEFANTPAGIATKAVVLSQAVTGANAETTERYRSRILRRVQQRPQGGAYADYRIWAEDVLGIINVYPYAGPPGVVNVYCEADEASSGSPDGIPTAPQLAAVSDAINGNDAGLAARRPVNAAPSVYAITRTAFAVEVSGLSPDTQAARDAIQEGVDEYLRSREPFIVGLSVLPRNDRVTNAAVSGIVDGIVSSFGATVTTVKLTPGPAYTLGQGEKAKLTLPITWV